MESVSQWRESSNSWLERASSVSELKSVPNADCLFFSLPDNLNNLPNYCLTLEGTRILEEDNFASNFQQTVPMFGQNTLLFIFELRHKRNELNVSFIWFPYIRCANVLCCCLVTKSCPTLLRPHELLHARLLCPSDFPSKNTSYSVLVSFKAFISHVEPYHVFPLLLFWILNTFKPILILSCCRLGEQWFFFFFPNMRIQQSWVAPDQVRMVCSSWLWLLELTFTVTFDFCDFFLFKNFFGLIIPDSLAEERKGILVTFNI